MGTEVIKCLSCGIAQTFYAPGVACKACRAIYNPDRNIGSARPADTTEDAPLFPESVADPETHTLDLT